MQKKWILTRFVVNGAKGPIEEVVQHNLALVTRHLLEIGVKPMLGTATNICWYCIRPRMPGLIPLASKTVSQSKTMLRIDFKIMKLNFGCSL